MQQLKLYYLKLKIKLKILAEANYLRNKTLL